MRSDELSKAVGKPIRDIYGRHVGLLNSFTVEGTDKVTDVGIDIGGGRLRKLPGARFVTGEEGPLMVPEWKLQAEGMGREIVNVKKRIEALKSLSADGEVSAHVYEELENEYSSKLRTLEEGHKQLSDQLSRRIQELDEEVSAMEQFIVEAKIQYRSGEMDDGTYQLVSGSCASLRAKNLQEKEEIQRALKTVNEPDILRVSMTIGAQAPKATA